MSVNFNLIDKVKNDVTILFNEKLSKDYLYHNITHTREVADTCLEIAKHSKLPDGEIEILLLAAWFHDTGYIFSSDDHEEKSARIMEQYLTKENYDKHKIEQIKKIILITKNNQVPKSINEKIIKDADLAHIGNENFDAKGKLLRQEWELLYRIKYSDLEWQKNQLNFIKNKKFYTEYAAKKFGERLKKNILLEKQKLMLIENESK